MSLPIPAASTLSSATLSGQNVSTQPEDEDQPEEAALSAGFQGFYGPARNQSPSPHPPRHHPDRDREAVRRGSFVERCQELAKSPEAAASSAFGMPPWSEGVRRSVAVCNELEARFNLRTPTSFTVSPGARHPPGTPSSMSSSPLSSSSLHRRATSTSPTTPASTMPSPNRCLTPVSSRRGAAASPAEASVSPESPDGTGGGTPSSPKLHMNETSF
ncbi:hypothetical protein XENOCAPTIV_026974 [Xenoophorus captivus]|uniref:Uncharacterized protein n=1 Tax=Xenoophorus captivus TaxID=1517983 RepID=A0ABV0RS99_9TELE